MAVSDLEAAPDESRLPPNPFVGPRALRYREPLFGRKRELDAIRDLVIAERILVLFSPSGAGKSSLLEAGLRPELERRNFRVLPTIRVSGELPPDLDVAVQNRFVLGTLLSLEAAAETELDVRELARRNLEDAFARYDRQAAGEPDPCFIFDQFEELFTVDPADLAAKSDFMSKLGEVLRDRGRWAIFAVRLDLVGELDRYCDLVPTRFGSRYRLDLLTKDAAKSAITNTADRVGVTISDDVATALVDDLSTMRIQRGGTTELVPGPYVEPVQLQVVCRHRWRQLADPRGPIEPTDPAAPSDVDKSLAEYYDEQVREVAEGTNTAEADIRTWFDESLISHHGIRTPALGGPVGDAPVDVLDRLVNSHLVRVEPRGGANWYELTHDRLVGPVRKSNASWRAEHHPLQRDTDYWSERGRPTRSLLTGAALQRAEEWAAAHPSQVRDVERQFLDASVAERNRDAAHRDRRRLQLTVAGVVTLVTLIGLGISLYLLWRATEAKQEANTRAESASKTYEAINDTDPLSQPLTWVTAYQLLDGSDADPFLERQVVSAAHHLHHDPAHIAVTGDLSPDGRVLARGTPDGRVELIPIQGESRSGPVCTSTPSPAGDASRTPVVSALHRVTDVEYSADGDLLAIAAEEPDGQFVVGVWDVHRGGDVTWFGDRVSREVDGLVFARDAVGGLVRRDGAAEDFDVRFWDLVTGRVGGGADVTAQRLLLSDDGNAVVISTDDGIKAGLPVDPQASASVVESTVAGDVPLAVSHDGSEIVIAAEGGQALSVVAVASATVQELELPEPPGELSAGSLFVAASFTDDGRVAALDEIGGLSFWQKGASGYEITKTVQLGPDSIGNDALVDFSSSGDRVVITRQGGRALSVWSLEGRSPVMLLGDRLVAPEPKGTFDQGAFDVDDSQYVMWGGAATSSQDPGGTYVAAGNSEGGVVVWDHRSHEESTRFVFDAPVDRIVLGDRRVAVVLGEGLFGGTDLRIFEKSDFVESGDDVPSPVGGLQLFVGGFASVRFTDSEASVELTESDGYCASERVDATRETVANAADQALSIATDRGLQ